MPSNCVIMAAFFLQDAHVQLITVRRKREDEEKRRLNEEVSSM